MKDAFASERGRFLLTLPFLQALGDAERVSFAGAGGGADVFAALPLYFAVRAMGKRAHFANLSTSELRASSARHLGGTLFCVDGETTTIETHFPERDLARWLATIRGDQTPIYGCRRVRVARTTATREHREYLHRRRARRPIR
jgi:hypothetical protein